MIEVDRKNHSSQVMIAVSHFQEDPPLDLSVMAQPVLLRKGEDSVPTNLKDSDGARKPAYYYFYILTHSTRPGNLDTVTDAKIRFMKPWIMREFSKCKVLFKAFDCFNNSHKKKYISFQIQICLSLECFSIRSVPFYG